MATHLTPLIAQVEKSDKSHVVVSFSDEHIHWHDGSESECQCMASILNNNPPEPVDEGIFDLANMVLGGQLDEKMRVIMTSTFTEYKVMPRIDFLTTLYMTDMGYTGGSTCD